MTREELRLATCGTTPLLLPHHYVELLCLDPTKATYQNIPSGPSIFRYATLGTYSLELAVYADPKPGDISSTFVVFIPS